MQPVWSNKEHQNALLLSTANLDEILTADYVEQIFAKKIRSYPLRSHDDAR